MLVAGELSDFTAAELRAIATRALADCCDECRSILREQLKREERDELAEPQE